MDIDIVKKHVDIIAKHYPSINLLQLGLTISMLGVIRASMGHENARSTIESYIHTNRLSPSVRQCVDFIEREILAIKRSKIDIDFWKRGNMGKFRRDKGLSEAKR